MEPAEIASNNTVAISGRLPDVSAYIGQTGFEAIPSAGWTPEVNAAWIQQNITAGNSFYLASPILEANILCEANPSGFTVFADEISTILGSGYQWAGEYLIPAP